MASINSIPATMAIGKILHNFKFALTNTNSTKNIKEEKSFIVRCLGLNLH